MSELAFWGPDVGFSRHPQGAGEFSRRPQLICGRPDRSGRVGCVEERREPRNAINRPLHEDVVPSAREERELRPPQGLRGEVYTYTYVLFTYIYMYIYIYVHTHTHTHTHAHAHTHPHARARICVKICICIGFYIWIYV
jgi:hypothetical protein